jgi:hypothetical protein
MPFGDDRNLHGADKFSNESRFKFDYIPGLSRVTAERGENRVRPGFRRLHGFFDGGNIGKDGNSEFPSYLPEPIEGSILLASGGAIEGNGIRACLHEFPGAIDRRRNQNLPVVLPDFENPDDGNGDSLADRANVLRPIGTNASRATLNGSLSKAGHRTGIAERACVGSLAGYDQVSAEFER